MRETNNTAFNKAMNLLHAMKTRENNYFGITGTAAILAIAIYGVTQFVASQFDGPISQCSDIYACNSAKIARDMITFIGNTGAGIGGIVGGVCALRAHDASTIKRQIQTAMVNYAIQTNNPKLLDDAFEQPES